MPNYWNPSNFYPVSYTPLYGTQPGYSGTPLQQSYTSQPTIVAAWVEGEMEARGRQMPQGATQFFMFDANQQKIYLKSINQMGMPNPMQILNFTIEDNTANLPGGQSGMSQTGANTDMSQYVTKHDLEQLRNEIRQMSQSGSNVNTNSSGNQNGGQNRGGNR